MVRRGSQQGSLWKREEVYKQRKSRAFLGEKRKLGKGGRLGMEKNAKKERGTRKKRGCL